MLFIFIFLRGGGGGLRTSTSHKLRRAWEPTEGGKSRSSPPHPLWGAIFSIYKAFFAMLGVFLSYGGRALLSLPSPPPSKKCLQVEQIKVCLSNVLMILIFFFLDVTHVRRSNQFALGVSSHKQSCR